MTAEALPPSCDDDDPDLLCALMANAGWSQDEIDAEAPLNCSNHWLSREELERRYEIILAPMIIREEAPE